MDRFNLSIDTDFVPKGREAMPHQRTIKYELMTYPVTVTIYTQEEMSEALDMKTEDFVNAIGRGEFCYHFAERVEGARLVHVFNEDCYNNNLDRKKKTKEDS